jgi:hypothetical protein
VSEQAFKANNSGPPLDVSSLSCHGKASAGRHLTNIPTEPSETLELSAHPWEPGRLCGDNDSSMGEQDGSSGERDETAARVQALGITSPLYKAFACVLSGHDHQARVNPTTAGFWQYHCAGLGRGIGLAEVRAFVAYGRERHLSGVEAARWRERLDFEAQLRSPVLLDVRLPEPCPDAARIVAGRMRVFVGLRDARFPLNESFVFAREFAQAYCELSPDRVRDALSWLERAGVIYRTGLSGRSILWKLTAQDVYAAGSENGGHM